MRLSAYLCIVTLAPSLGWAAPAQLTRGPGDDTEAAWAPDGTRIVFQSDRGAARRRMGVFVLDLKTRRVTRLETGPGHACFPAWSPDGQWIVYAHARFTQTALEAYRSKSQNGYNLYAVPLAGGAPRRLTKGRYRDYCPAFSRDGKTVYFSSTRGRPAKGRFAGVQVMAMPFAGGEPQALIQPPPGDHAAVQPTTSPDGKILAYGYIAGFRGNWTLRLARAAAPEDTAALTDVDRSFYGPRWHPTEPVLACTGYEPGDAGWNVWLIHAKTGQRLRVTSGPGNSRCPAWSPDGKRLVFENNQTGRYKLYAIDAPPLPRRKPMSEADRAAGAVLHYSFASRSDKTVADQSGRGNDGLVVGEVQWSEAGARLTNDGAYITVPQPKGLDFSMDAFSVKATVTLTERVDRLAFICMGKYAGNTLGWQLFVDKRGRALFNSRTPELRYVGVASDRPLPLGRPITIAAVRHADGRVTIFVDGEQQISANVGATRSYGKPIEVRVGRQHSGAWPFCGWIREVAVYRRALSASELMSETLDRFWGNVEPQRRKGAQREKGGKVE